jgi:hypothetical protein
LRPVRSGIYWLSVRFFSKLLGIIGLLMVVGLLGVGCGGFSASPSISPATFLLPGFGAKDEPPVIPATAPAVPSPVEAAS